MPQQINTIQAFKLLNNSKNYTFTIHSERSHSKIELKNPLIDSTFLEQETGFSLNISIENRKTELYFLPEIKNKFTSFK